MTDTPSIHPSQAELLRYFEYEHLPPHLKAVSKHFHWLAHALVGNQDVAAGEGTGHSEKRVTLNLSGPELTVALRKLLEAKDCAVRAAL